MIQILFFINWFVPNAQHLRSFYGVKPPIQNPWLLPFKNWVFKCNQNHTYWIESFSQFDIEYLPTVWCHKNFGIFSNTSKLTNLSIHKGGLLQRPKKDDRIWPCKMTNLSCRTCKMTEFDLIGWVWPKLCKH